MRWLLPLALAAVCLLSLPSRETRAAGRARVTPPDGLNLRDAPSTAGRILETLPYNRLVDVMFGPVNGNWYEVSDNGLLGYVRGDYLDFGSLPSLQVGGDALVVPSDGVHLRGGPSLTSPVLATLISGTVVHLTGGPTADGWYAVQSPSGAGWVDGQYLQAVQPGSGPVRITWYGHDFDGGALACGGTYSADDPTIAAALGWPCGTRLHVCANGACIDVVVRDRGRMGLGSIDLSLAAFQRLAPAATGTLMGTVSVSTGP